MGIMTAIAIAIAIAIAVAVAIAIAIAMQFVSWCAVRFLVWSVTFCESLCQPSRFLISCRSIFEQFLKEIFWEFKCH